MRGGIKADCRHMHQISDGERRRVQLCMGLMTEWDVLLLDEVRSLDKWKNAWSTDIRLP